MTSSCWLSVAADYTTDEKKKPPGRRQGLGMMEQVEGQG